MFVVGGVGELWGLVGDDDRDTYMLSGVCLNPAINTFTHLVNASLPSHVCTPTTHSCISLQLPTHSHPHTYTHPPTHLHTDLSGAQVSQRWSTMLGRLQQGLTNWANNNPAQHRSVVNACLCVEG